MKSFLPTRSNVFLSHLLYHRHFIEMCHWSLQSETGFEGGHELCRASVITGSMAPADQDLTTAVLLYSAGSDQKLEKQFELKETFQRFD